MGDNVNKLWMLAIVLVLMNISFVSANEVNDTVISTDNLNQSIEPSLLPLSSSDDEIPEYPDLIDKNYTYVYSSTINNFFTEGVLDNKYSGRNLIFSGNFENIGQLEIGCSDVSVTGSDSNLKNTVFRLTGSRISLNNLNFNIDNHIKGNDGAAIFVAGDDISLVDLTINYTVPKDVQAYAIYADGYNYGPFEHLNIINSSIYFEGHNDNVKLYNCGVKLKDICDAVVENNTIITNLPLKNINYDVSGANLDSAYVYSVGIEGCHGLLLNNNTIISDVNKRTADEYPTLDCIMICKSDNVIISNNSISMTDFATYPGVENYLYGIDIHDLNDLWIVNNSISIVTTGGKLALGTAYPIQISGPIKGGNIEYNDLYSFSNGPNIGIYSQCYYGPTYVSIKYNKINVTGLAGTHDWALVTGIESQDTYSEIFNNQIEVHSVADVGINDNLYAISYRQSINGPNTFDIENNVAVSDGFYSVYILGSDYSNIINNTLISFNDNVKNGDDAYSQGSRRHNEEYSSDNKVIRAVDYYSSKNYIDNDNIIEISDSGSSNTINTNSISPRTQQDNIFTIPSVPSFNDWIVNQKETTDFVDDGSLHATINEDVNAQESNSQSDVNQNQNVGVYKGDINIKSSGNITNVYGNNLKIVSNSSSSAIGISNDLVNGKQASASGSQSQSVSKKVYDLKESVKEENIFQSEFIVVLVTFLLFIGFECKREEI